MVNGFYLSLLFIASLFYKEPLYMKILDTITFEITREFQKEKNIFLRTKITRMKDANQKVNISYIVQNAMSLDEARKLYVEIAEEYLRRINEDTKLRPFLHSYPFTIENLCIEISFLDEKNHWHPELSCLFYYKRNKTLAYTTYNPLTQKLDDYYQEPYEEALRLVRLEAQKNAIHREEL